jgi:hypothetical protein
MAVEKLRMLVLEIKDLQQIQLEYPEFYEELFRSQLEALENLLSRKKSAIDHLENERLREEEANRKPEPLKPNNLGNSFNLLALEGIFGQTPNKKTGSDDSSGRDGDGGAYDSGDDQREQLITNISDSLF